MALAFLSSKWQAQPQRVRNFAVGSTVPILGYLFWSFVKGYSKSNKTPDNDVLETVVDGEEGRPILFFIHGWPDSHELWLRQVKHFSPNYVCVRIRLPNFGTSYEQHSDHAWGYNPAVIRDMIIKKMKWACKEYNQPKLNVVAHDWGSAVAQTVVRKVPQLVNSFVMVDVGVGAQPSGIGNLMFLLWYTSFLASAFALPSAIGDAMTKIVATYVWDAPCVREGRGHEITSSMNYFYWRMYLSLFGINTDKELFGEMVFPEEIPMMFIGGKKSNKYYDKEFENLVKGRENCQWYDLDAGHWVMVDKPNEFNSLVSEFLSQWSKEQ